MNALQNTWETYARSWKVASADEKRALYRESLDPSCIYRDPLTQRNGWDELLTYMKEFHQQIPGGHFRTVEFIAHHDRSIARWEMCNEEEAVLGTGMSYGEYNAEGKLISMTGFFEPPAS